MILLDSRGRLENAGSTELIQPEIKPLLEKITHLCIAKLSSTLTSLYVRGSVSVGRAYPNSPHIYSSDLDLVAVTHTTIEPSTCFSIVNQADKILANDPVVAEVDLSIVALDELLTNEKCARLRVYLSTQSVLLYGPDVVAEQLPRFKPDRSLAVYMYPSIQDELQHLREILLGDSHQREYAMKQRSTPFWCVWTMRTILRSGQALVMSTEGDYESDLEYCKRRVSAVYPNLGPLMNQAYIWALHPINDVERIVRLLDEFCSVFLPLWQRIVLHEQC